MRRAFSFASVVPLGQPLNIRERAKSPPDWRQANLSRMGALGCAVEDEITQILSGTESVWWAIFCSLKNMKIDQVLSSKNGFWLSFWSRVQSNSWKSKGPPYRGSHLPQAHPSSFEIQIELDHGRRDGADVLVATIAPCDCLMCGVALALMPP